VIKAGGQGVDDWCMSQPYEFFPGAAKPEPAAGFGQPASPYVVAAPTLASPRDTPARPAMVSVLAGLLVAQAALVAGPAIALLLIRDTIAALAGAFTSSIGGASDLTDPTATGSPEAGSLTMWAIALLLVTVLSALAGLAVMDRRVWAFATAGLAEAGLLVWGVVHFGSLPSLSGVAVLLAVVIGGLLATPDVRRWCLTG
jgi:hypothetical protein